MSATREQRRAAIEAKTARELVSAFKALGVSLGVINELEAWTHTLTERRRVLDFLHYLAAGLDEARADGELTREVYGGGKYDIKHRRAIPGEIAELQEVIGGLIDNIEKALRLHFGSRSRPITHVFHPGLAFAAGHLSAARNLLLEYDVEWDPDLPKLRRGRKRDILTHRLRKLGLKSGRRKDIVRALQTCLLKMRQHPDRKRAARLATQLVDAVYAHVEAKCDAEREKPEQISPS